MKRPTCDEIRELLSAYVDRVAGRNEATTVRAHLAACAVCRRQAAEWQALNRLLDRGLATSPPVEPDEVEAAVRRVREVDPPWRLVPVSLRFWRSWAPVAAMAAAAVVLVLAGSYSPPVADAGPALREWAASAIPTNPDDVVGLVQIDLAAWREAARAMPQSTADRVVHEWDRGLGLSLDLGRRIPLGPLAAGALVLLLANVAFVRTVRGTLRPAQGG